MSMLTKRTSYRTRLLPDDRARRFAARLRVEPGVEKVQIIEPADTARSSALRPRTGALPVEVSLRAKRRSLPPLPPETAARSLPVGDRQRRSSP